MALLSHASLTVDLKNSTPHTCTGKKMRSLRCALHQTTISSQRRIFIASIIAALHNVEGELRCGRRGE
jgi:hypothetical protein